MSITRLAFSILLATFFWVAGCATQPEPLAGWQPLFGRENEAENMVIKGDYQAYIQKMPSSQSGFVGPIQLFQDGTGQHAVRIEIARNGTDWAHVLIYDKENKRVKVYRYVSGHYRS